MIRAWRRARALGRMGRHERWRVAMMSDPSSSGEVYCHCDRCERDFARYIANGGTMGVRQPRSKYYRGFLPWGFERDEEGRLVDDDRVLVDQERLDVLIALGMLPSYIVLVTPGDRGR